MRRSLTLLVTVAVLIGLMAVPAAADKPTPFPYSDEFVGWNPCTGEPHMVWLEGVAYDHFHNNNFVSPSQRTGFTDSGYELVQGRDNVRANMNHFIVNFQEVWDNGEGSRYQASGRFKFTFKDEAIKFDEFTLKCLGAPTIPPPE